MVKLSWMLLVVLFVGCTGLQPRLSPSVEYNEEQQDDLLQRLLQFQEEQQRQQEEEKKAQERKRKLSELWA